MEEKLREIKHFDNCYSLGWFCGTTSSLQNIGLRTSSGPFDWYFSEFSGVLKQIEDDFVDFLNISNLDIIANGTEFKDLKYGFHFIHDIKENFYEEIEAVREKYMRRINSFRSRISNPTVFFRCIQNQKEIDYINYNWMYADELVKKYNHQNEIIYVYKKDLKGLTNQVSSFSLDISDYIGKTYEMRHMFGYSKELCIFCNKLINPNQMKKNIDFDKRVNGQRVIAEYVSRMIREDLDGIDCYILDSLKAEKRDGIYIWGAGTLGIPLAKYLKKRKINILAIIDNSDIEKKEGFNICKFDKVDDGAKIFISVCDSNSKDSIVEQIRRTHKKTIISYYQELYEYF